MKELYQQVIIDHSRHPHNFEELSDATHQADGQNPMCGDQVRLTLKVKNAVVAKATFTGEGCAISKASASMLTDVIVGMSVNNAVHFAHQVIYVVNGRVKENIGKLQVFENISQFPGRVKCATMAWHALLDALNDKRNEAVGPTTKSTRKK